MEQSNPEVRDISATARDTFYVDDDLDSTSNPTEAKRKVEVVDETCRRSGFQLRKWASNYPEVLAAVTPDRRADVGCDVNLGTDSLNELTTLGMKWRPETDKLTYRAPEMKEVTTRRELLSNMTKLFDPLGLVSPWTLNCRVLVQNLCKRKLTWDEPIPDEHLKKWIKWRYGTQAVTEIQFDRCVNSYYPDSNSAYQQHVFSDASEKGHGAVAYIRTEGTEKIESRLIYARSRVNPLKGETIPRAELVAAALGAKTTGKLKREL